MEKESKKKMPAVMTNLRQDVIQVPDVIRRASGININGKRIKSIIFTTDVAIAVNNNADAVLAVYPFTPHPAVIQAMTATSSLPVISGVGGGTTQGTRSAYMALFAEALGSMAVICNAPTPFSTVREIDGMIDIPIIMTIVSKYTEIGPRLDAGVDILNVSGGHETAAIVRKIRQDFPDVPIIATGGRTEESIIETIQAGANAITYVPPTTNVLFNERMKKYRIEEEARWQDKNEEKESGEQ